MERIREILTKEYPTVCGLNFSSPYQLLVAARLAAQCTDARVNLVTPKLFELCPTPFEMSRIPVYELCALIKTCGFYNSKARDISKCANILLEQFDGEVPNTMEHLMQLPGVGRKTANLILGECFNIPGIVVDTHCIRVSRRLGLATGNTPEKIERELMAVVPQDYWIDIGHHFVEHGRRQCTARNPKCGVCVLKSECKNVQ